MSILIKGMAMPPNDGRGRRVCFTQKDGEWVLIVEDAKSYDDRTANVYPLVEIPEPHGDLIDRDFVEAEIERNIREYYDSTGGGFYLAEDAQEIVHFAPGVIEREAKDDVAND